jgi:hypothetical protein
MDTDPHSLPSPGLRGATVIPESVVAHVTDRAAREALSRQSGGPPSAHLSLSAPRAKAVVHHGSARIFVSLDLPYPIDIAGVCGEVRHYISERVSELTGMRIDDVTVSVRRLVPSESLRPGRVH